MKKRYTVLLFLISLFLIACDDFDPEKIRKRQHLPSKNFVADVQQGKILFSANCAHCHGVDGFGSKQGPPLINKVYRTGHHADMAFHWAIKDGVRQHHWKFGDMPPQPNVSPEGAGHITAYIRKEQHKAGIR